MFRIRTALATTAVAVVAALALAAPASAHDAPVSSTPADGEQLTVAPEEVSMTFSNNLLVSGENTGAEVEVLDESGENWVDGDAQVVADTISAPLKKGMPNGTYEVTFRVVSSDGHPTDENISFSLEAESAEPTEAPETEAPETETTEAPDETDQAADQPDDQTQDQVESAPWPLIIGLGVVVLIAIVVFVVILVRKKK